MYVDVCGYTYFMIHWIILNAGVKFWRYSIHLQIFDSHPKWSKQKTSFCTPSQHIEK